MDLQVSKRKISFLNQGQEKHFYSLLNIYGPTIHIKKP